MLLTITPNPCIERTVQLYDFAPGAVYRVAPERLFVNAGGKGINAARVASQLGCATRALAWVGRRQRLWFAEQMEHEGIAHELVESEADTRVCLNILSEGRDKTEIVEAGGGLTIADGTRLLERYAALLPQAKLVAICGSYPQAANPAQQTALDAHLALLVQMARGAGKRVLVDGKGRSFEMALRSKTPPWCVKPNLEEAAALLGRAIATPQAERRAVRDILRRGVEIVILSCGERGAYFGTAQGIWFARAPQVKTLSPVGSGDALVGAFCAKFLETNDLFTAARWGVAAGAANAAQAQSAFVKESDIAPLLTQVKIEASELKLMPN